MTMLNAPGSPPANLDFILRDTPPDAAPPSWPLALFCTWILQVRELSEAVIRHVWCNRDGVHEYILLNCHVTVGNRVVTLWLRIDRRPASQGIAVLSNKPKPAEDTVTSSTDPKKLRKKCDNRDSIVYDPNQNPRQVLKLKHIAEMYQYFTGHSNDYVLLGANCRWLCYLLLDCLRECQPCYGGHAFDRNPPSKIAVDLKAAQLAKAHYLRDKHPNCCANRSRAYTNTEAHITATTVRVTSVGIGSSGDRDNHNRDSQYEYNETIELNTVVTSTSGNLGTQQHPGLNSSMAPSNVNAPPVHGSLQPTYEQAGASSHPASANATQSQQSSPSSENIPEDVPSQSEAGRYRELPHIHRVTSRPSGEAHSPSHCQGCRCTSHSGHRPKPANRVPSASHRCSISSVQGSILTQSPVSATFPTPATPQSVFSALPTHAERIHVHQDSIPCCGPSSAYAGQAARNGTLQMATQHSSCHCSSHTNPHGDARMVPLPASRTVTVETSDAYFASSSSHVPRRPPSGAGSAGPTSSYAMHDHGALSLALHDSCCGSPTSVHMQGRHYTHYTHNHPRHGQRPGSTCSISYDIPGPSPHACANIPLPRRVHEPPRTPTHHGIRSGFQGYTSPGQSMDHTSDPYYPQPEGSYYTSYPGHPPPGGSNRSDVYQFREQLARTQLSSSFAGYRENPAEMYHYPPQPNLSMIPESEPQSIPDNRWDPLHGSIAINPTSRHGVQHPIPTYASTQARPLPSFSPSNPVAYGHSQNHLPEATSHDRYVASGASASPHPELRSSTNRWMTQAEWGNSGLTPPERTDSPSPWGGAPTDNGCSMPQDLPPLIDIDAPDVPGNVHQ